MTVRDLIPWTRRRSEVPGLRGETPEGRLSPFFTLHREMNRLFDEAFRGFESVPGFGRLADWPSVEVSDSDNELRVIAELPGMEEKDIDVALHEGVLTIRGEKRGETAEDGQTYSERYYGRFERRIPLGMEVEQDKAQANFANGVLTVTLPKSPAAQSNVKRIPIGQAAGH